MPWDISIAQWRRPDTSAGGLLTSTGKRRRQVQRFEILFSAWQHAAALLGQTLDWRDTGGGSDGNILQAVGLPIIDNLGIIGDQIHSPDEWASLSSIPERTALVTMFLHMLSDGEFDRVSHPAFAHHLKSLQEQQNSFHYPSAHS